MFARAIPDALPHRGRELVQGPGVAGRDVVPGGRHAPPRLDAGLVPGPARARDPRGPAGDVDLRQRVEGWAERPNSPCLIGSKLRLVGCERRHGDVVLRAGRSACREPRGESKPVSRRVEDCPQRLAIGRLTAWERGRCTSSLHTAPWPRASATEPAPDGRFIPRLDIRRAQRPDDERSGDEAAAEQDEPPQHVQPLHLCVLENMRRVAAGDSARFAAAPGAARNPSKGAFQPPQVNR